MLRTDYGSCLWTQWTHRIPLSVIRRTEVAHPSIKYTHHLFPTSGKQPLSTKKKKINAHHCLFGGRAALDSNPHRGATWLKKNTSKRLFVLSTVPVCLSFSVTWPVFHSWKRLPRESRKGVAFVCGTDSSFSLPPWADAHRHGFKYKL